jgi:LPS export ABC transporter protein LptC
VASKPLAHTKIREPDMASAVPETHRRSTLRRAVSVCLLGALVVVGCSSGKRVSGSGVSGELPDNEVQDFNVTETDSGRTQWTMFARSAATYSARDLVVVRTVRIDFFGEDGTKSSTLTAREGELMQRSRDMIARGGVVLQTVEGWRMTTEEMSFLNSTGRIHSDQLVRVEKEGSVLEGVGFDSDPDLVHFEFREKVRATVMPGAGRGVSGGGK